MSGEAFDVSVVPLSMVRESNGLIFVSGHVPIEDDGHLSTGTIGEQTDLVFRNIGRVLADVGSSLDDVIKVNVFLTHAARDFPAMNEAYAKHFPRDPKPARSTMGVELAVDVLIEIECIAVRPSGDQ